MFKTLSTKAAALALAATCAFTMTLGAGAAEAKRRDAVIIGAAAIGGLILGNAIGRAAEPRYVEVDYIPARRCWTKRKLVGYTLDGDPIVRRQRVCTR
jgi:hypothetical protein